MTRHAVIQVARKLFATDGYEQTTIEKIAREARVSPATVYAQCGGKEGLLRGLMDIWTSSDLVTRIIADCAAATTGGTKLKALADGYVELYALDEDIIRIITRAAASAPSAATFLEIADQRHLEALSVIVQGIRGVGDLADGLSADDAARIIFFHFRHAQYALAVDTFGWGVDRTKQWLLERVEDAILKG